MWLGPELHFGLKKTCKISILLEFLWVYWGLISKVNGVFSRNLVFFRIEVSPSCVHRIDFGLSFKFQLYSLSSLITSCFRLFLFIRVSILLVARVCYCLFFFCCFSLVWSFRLFCSWLVPLRQFFIETSFVLRTLEWWDAVLQKRLAWGLFVLLLSVSQQREALFVPKFSNFTPPPPLRWRRTQMLLPCPPRPLCRGKKRAALFSKTPDKKEAHGGEGGG